MNVLPPAFVREGVPYVPNEEEMANCRWAQIAFSKCPKPSDCASCPVHPQNRSRLRREKLEAERGKQRDPPSRS